MVRSLTIMCIAMTSRLSSVLLALLFVGSSLAEEYEPPSMSPDQLQNYQFEHSATEEQAKVEDLSFGQQFAMSRQRSQVDELLARHLGVSELAENSGDIKTLQQLIDLEVIKSDDVTTWQALGVVVGDLIARQFDLHWVSYEDELGVSRALQWQDTMNFVFPVTLLSKRVQFGQQINLAEIIEKLRGDIEAFKAYEKDHKRLEMPGSERLNTDTE